MSPKPTKAQLLASKNRLVADVIAPNLRVLFCGINPGLYSAAVSHHFARPGNRFWPALHLAGITSRLLSPDEERELLNVGCGITNIVARATATADELSAEELIAGQHQLELKVARYQPHVVAVLGVSAYRTGWQRPKATLGLQPDRLSHSTLWVLPNPSGLNAHYSLSALAKLLQEVYQFSQSL
ncbi:MAG: G/U mismatch-specific DNA glycosylase [Anaerolineae bacterium]